MLLSNASGPSAPQSHSRSSRSLVPPLSGLSASFCESFPPPDGGRPFVQSRGLGSRTSNIAAGIPNPYGLNLMASSKLQMPSCPIPPQSHHGTNSKQCKVRRSIPKCLQYPPVRGTSYGSPHESAFGIPGINSMATSFHADLWRMEASCGVDYAAQSKIHSNGPISPNTRDGVSNTRQRMNGQRERSDEHDSSSKKLEAECQVVASSMAIHLIPKSSICDPTGKVGVRAANVRNNTASALSTANSTVPRQSSPVPHDRHPMVSPPVPRPDFVQQKSHSLGQATAGTTAGTTPSRPSSTNIELPAIDKEFDPPNPATTTRMPTVTCRFDDIDHLNRTVNKVNTAPSVNSLSTMNTMNTMNSLRSLNGIPRMNSAPINNIASISPTILPDRAHSFLCTPPTAQTANSMNSLPRTAAGASSGTGTGSAINCSPATHSLPSHSTSSVRSPPVPPVPAVPPAPSNTDTAARSRSTENAFSSPVLQGIQQPLSFLSNLNGLKSLNNINDAVDTGTRGTGRQPSQIDRSAISEINAQRNAPPKTGQTTLRTTSATTKKVDQQNHQKRPVIGSTPTAIGRSLISVHRQVESRNINGTDPIQSTKCNHKTNGNAPRSMSMISRRKDSKQKQKGKGKKEERPYRCSKCTKSFRNKAGLSNHKIIHNGLKPHKCKFANCSKAFARSCDLTRHTRLHTGDKPFKCTMGDCKKAFTRSVQLRLHVMDHTGYRPFHCQVCGKGFKTLQNSQIHMRIHTGERPYQCKHCKKRFTQSSSMRTHVTSMHRDIVEK